jgi:ankyrin repeat protein
MVKYIWRLGVLTVDDLRNDINCALDQACANGQLEVVKYIWQLDLLNVDDLRPTNNKDAFVFACMNGHIAIVKYLWQLGLLTVNALRPSKPVYKCRSGFIHACNNGHTEVVAYLWGLGLLTVDDLYDCKKQYHPDYDFPYRSQPLNVLGYMGWVQNLKYERYQVYLETFNA